MCSCPSPCWWTAEGAPRGRAPAPGPQMLLVFPGRGNPASPPILPRADTVGVWTPGLGSRGTREEGGGGSFSNARRAVFVRYLNPGEVSAWSPGQCAFLRLVLLFCPRRPPERLAQLRWLLFARLHPTEQDSRSLWPTLPIRFYQHIPTPTCTHTLFTSNPVLPPGVTCLTQAGHCPRPASLPHLSPSFQRRMGAGGLQKLPGRAETSRPGASTLASQAGS